MLASGIVDLVLSAICCRPRRRSGPIGLLIGINLLFGDWCLIASVTPAGRNAARLVRAQATGNPLQILLLCTCIGPWPAPRSASFPQKQPL
jgi:hypothetical protein